MDTWRPLVNYRCLDEFNKALGHRLERAMQPAAVGRVLLRRPRLGWYAFAGYLFPSAFRP
jgi:hypothetical protein